MHSVKCEPTTPVGGRLPIPSDALHTNLQRTVAPVRIPPEQELLLEIVKEKVGIREHTESLLREVNHPYVDWDEIVEPLRARALGDFYDYDEHEKGPEAFSIFFSLLLRSLESCSSEERRIRVFATLFDLLELIVLEAKSAPERNQAVIEQVLSRLQAWLLKEPLPAAKGTTKITKVARTLLEAEPAYGLQRLAALHLHCLEKNHETWLSQGDLTEWFLSERDRLFGGRDYQHLLLSVSPQRLQSFLDALDGISVEALASNLDLLQHALESRRITVDQYLNIFQIIARTVKEIIQTQYIGIHEGTLQTVISQLLQGNHPLPFTPAAGSTAEQIGHQAWEWFIRDHLASRFCIQSLDNFVGKVVASLAQESQSLDRRTRTLLLSYNPERCFVPFESSDYTLDTQIYLGNKGYFLKCLRSFGYPVPPGAECERRFRWGYGGGHHRGIRDAHPNRIPVG